MKARLPRGMGGGPQNMQAMVKQAQKMQEEMEKAQEELNEREYTTSAGGGMVECTINGKKELIALNIKKEAVDPDDVEILQDMIIGAVNEAIRKAEEVHAAEMEKITNGLSLPGPRPLSPSAPSGFNPSLLPSGTISWFRRSLPLPGSALFSRLLHTVSKGSQAFPQAVIPPVGVGHGPGRRQVEGVLFIHIFFVHVHRHHLGQKHMMASQLIHPHHPALQVHRTFPDQRH